MAEYLRSDEILACVHRVALSRGEPFPFVAEPLSPELARRRRVAGEHRRAVIDELKHRHHFTDAPTALDLSARMSEGAELIRPSRPLRDEVGERVASVQALVRVGRIGERYAYAPLLIKQHEAIERSSTRRTLEGSLDRLRPNEATFTEGVGVRSTLPMTRSGLSLSHATRVLESLGHGDPHAQAGLIDRQQRLWWLKLDGDAYPRFNLKAYDRLYEERRTVLDAHDRWLSDRGEFPTAPYWHRECELCPYGAYCEAELEALDDVSLVRFTSIEQQLLLKDHGVATRSALARLDPARARHARHHALPSVAHGTEDVLGRAIDKLDDLIYRARANRRGTSLRRVNVSEMGCATADVEVDVDMESCDDGTYLWGAYVSRRHDTEQVGAGYHAFVEWTPLTPEREAANFARFWRWLEDLRSASEGAHRSFAAYCFWAQAEDGAMNRAVATAIEGGPSRADLDAFRSATPPRWIDVHDVAKRQIQTEGPLGLKQLAVAAGFQWRDPSPSGEASIVWHDEAVSDDADAATRARQRLLEYNEDDCRATKALRDWLNNEARSLAHRDDV